MKLGHHEAIVESGFSGTFRLHSGYDAAFVQQLKVSIPGKARKWDNYAKVWIVSLSYLDTVIQLLSQFHYTISYVGDISTPSGAGNEEVTETIRLNYLGNARQRGRLEVTSSGMNEQGEWVYIFPASVLMDWFGMPDFNPLTASTLYEALGVSATADSAAIKKAYRQLVKRWHPDVCDDPQAGEVLRAVAEAHEILSDERKRKLYNIGFQIQATNKPVSDIVFAVPDRWRCGYLSVTGVWMMGRLSVTAIHSWDDIINNAGQRLTSRWNAAINGNIEYNWI